MVTDHTLWLLRGIPCRCNWRENVQIKKQEKNHLSLRMQMFYIFLLFFSFFFSFFFQSWSLSFLFTHFFFLGFTKIFFKVVFFKNLQIEVCQNCQVLDSIALHRLFSGSFGFDEDFKKYVTILPVCMQPVFSMQFEILLYVTHSSCLYV